MPNWRAIRTVTLWALAADPAVGTPAQPATPRASGRVGNWVLSKLPPDRLASASRRSGPAGNVLHHLRSAPPSTSRNRSGWSRCGIATLDVGEARPDALHPPSTLRLLHSHMIVGCLPPP